MALRFPTPVAKVYWPYAAGGKYIVFNPK